MTRRPAQLCMMNAMTMSTATSDVDHERKREAGDAGLAWSEIPAGGSLEKERSGEDEAPPGSDVLKMNFC